MLCAILRELYKSYTGISEADVGTLKNPTEAFHETVVLTYRLAQGMAPSLMCRSGIAHQIMSSVMSTEKVKALVASLCHQNCLSQMLSQFVRMQLHAMCKVKGNAMKERPRNKACREALKLPPRV